MNDRIELAESTFGFPAQYLEADGRIIFDTWDGFTFELTERLSELTEATQITKSAVLGFDLPSTPKNDYLFRAFRTANLMYNQFSALKVTCITASGRILQQDQMWLFSFNDAEKSYQVEIYDTDDFWPIQAEELTFDQLDLGTFTVSELNMIDNWQTPEYADGQDPFYFGLVHYGGFWGNMNEFFMDDLRPLLSVPALLTKAFQEIGWTFDSPLLSSPWFNRLWVYILKEELSYSTMGDGLYNAEASTLSTFTVSRDTGVPNVARKYFLFDTVISDPGGNLLTNTHATINDHTVYSLTEGVPAVMGVSIAVTLLGDALGGSARIGVADVDDLDNPIVLTSQSFSVGASESKSIVFEEEFYATTIRNIAFFVEFESSNGVDPTPLIYAIAPTITLRSVSNRVHRGDTVTISELVSSDYTLIDFLRGLAHLGNFRFNTDWGTRTVSMYPEMTADVYGQDVEGFIFPYDSNVDVSDSVIPESLFASFPKSRPNRYVSLRWKESKDSFIEELKLPEEGPLHSRKIDLGEALKKETTINENPFFEPTGNITINEVSMPAMWDNTNDEISYKIGPRILYAVGFTRQYDPVTGDGFAWNFEFQVRPNLPYVAQLPEGYIDTGAGPELPTGNVVFGDKDPDLFTTFYASAVLDARFSPTYEFKIKASDVLFESLDFRSRLHIEYGQETIIARLLEKREFKTDLSEPFTIVVRPEYQDVDVKTPLEELPAAGEQPSPG